MFRGYMRRIYEQSKVFLRFIHYQLMKSHEINSGHISICQFREEIRNRYEGGESLFFCRKVNLIKILG